MPLVWRVVHVIDKLTQGMGMTFTIEDLLYLYETKTVKNSRYTFFLKSGQRSLVENSGANDKGWKKRYLFVNKKSLGKDFEYLRGGWNSEGTYHSLCYACRRVNCWHLLISFVFVEVLPLPVEESLYSKTKVIRLLTKYNAQERTFRNNFKLPASDNDALPQSADEHTNTTIDPTKDTSPSMASGIIFNVRLVLFPFYSLHMYFQCTNVVHTLARKHYVHQIQDAYQQRKQAATILWLKCWSEPRKESKPQAVWSWCRRPWMPPKLLRRSLWRELSGFLGRRYKKGKLSLSTSPRISVRLRLRPSSHRQRNWRSLVHNDVWLVSLWRRWQMRRWLCKFM